MKVAAIFLLLWLQVKCIISASLLESLYFFTDARSSSTNIGISPREYDAKRAIQVGSGYWCSEGNHENDTIVTWIGDLNSRTTLAGLRVRWTYSPRETKISGLNDGSNEIVLRDWHNTASSLESFDESFMFSKPSIVSNIKISMRGPINKFFGISFVSPIPFGYPTLQLISGITSTAGELCLQVAKGAVNINGTPVVLDYCTFALAAGDGRDLWRFNSNRQIVASTSNPPKCLTLTGLNVTDGGNIVLEDCTQSLDAGDNRSVWEFQGNGQIELTALKKNYCLSQFGSSAGFTNLVNGKEAKVKASSINSEAHKPENAIDGSLQTYWASQPMKDNSEQLVVFDIDTTNPSLISKIRIDWEFPPLQYSISTSNDLSSWMENVQKIANPSNVTTDSIGVFARYIRISMGKPHSEYGKEKNYYFYGIRDIQLLSNRLKSIVELCPQAANRPDGRDKYFPKAVHEFNPMLSTKLVNAHTNLESRLQSVQLALNNVESSIPRLEKCASNLDTYKNEINEAANALNSIKQKTNSLGMNKLNLAGKQLSEGLKIGHTKMFPGEDCVYIKKRYPKSSSGFYWISPKCSFKPIRAWCNMDTGISYIIWNGHMPQPVNTTINQMVSSIDDYRLRCAELGLEPINIKGISDIETISSVVKTMGFNLKQNQVIPIAYNPKCFTGRCSHVFRDLNFGEDITNYLMDKTNIEELGLAKSGFNTAGLNGDHISYFNWDQAEIKAIVCSTNIGYEDRSIDFLSLRCEDSVADFPIFNGSIDTNILVDCPPGCLEHPAKVYGDSKLYHSSSSICRAGLHAGVLQQGGTMNIAIEGANEMFQGTLSNGVQSISLKNDDGSNSFRVGPVPKECPIDLISSSPVVSFLQVSATSKTSLGKLQTNSKLELSIEMSKELNRILDLINEAHGLDFSLISLTSEFAAKSLSNARKYLKKAETDSFKHGEKAIVLFTETSSFSEMLFHSTTENFSRFNRAADHLKELKERSSQRTNFGSWNSLNPEVNAKPFESSWKIINTFGVSGTPDWKYDKTTKGVIVQTGFILCDSQSVGCGTIALLTNHHFFDFTLQTNIIFASDTAVGGIVFRAKDALNYYLFEVNKISGGSKRLLKILNRSVTVLAEKLDGGYVPYEDYVVEIQAAKGRIKICMGKKGSELITVFDLIDESFLSGTIGLYSSQTSDKNSIYFSNIQVKSEKCQKHKAISAPVAPQCNLYKQDYYQPLKSSYIIHDHVEAAFQPSEWTYVKDKEHGYFIKQISAIKSTNQPASLLILKQKNSCSKGIISANFLMSSCSSGHAGFILNFQDFDHFIFLGITSNKVYLKKKNGKTNILEIHSLESSNFKIDTNIWIHASVYMNLNTFKVNLSSSNQLNVTRTFQNDLLLSNNLDAKRVGLWVSNCPNILFDDFKLYSEEASFLIKSPEFFSNTTYLPCINNKGYLERENLCKTYQLACKGNNFCNLCCDFKTFLLSSDIKKSCLAQCEANNVYSMRTKQIWLRSIDHCLTNDFTEICNKIHQQTINFNDDNSCQLEMCETCCLTYNSYENMSVKQNVTQIEEYFKLDNIPMETSNCKMFCGNKYKTHKKPIISAEL